MATEKKITSRIQQKHDVAANWAKATNFIPKKGEIIIYDAEYNASGEETQAVRFKIGDGSKTVNNLPFAVIDYSSDIETLEQKVANNSTAIGALQENTVPKTRKINNKALSSDITLGAADVGVNETTFPGLKKTGTVTGVKMNGTTKTPSSGVVDLGTVLMDESAFATSAQGTKADNAMPKSGGTFTGEVKFGNTENFQGYYIKRMIGSLGAGTAYENLDSSYKDGTWHRMWRLRFPSDSHFWGKIKITLYGGFSSFNASGVMSKSITCNFNSSSIYNNVGCYDGLGVNVEQDFRISEAIWNATASAWEVLIWQKNLSGNNSPVIMLECWTTNVLNYIKAFKGIAAQAVELTRSTSYSAQKASSTGGTKTVEWATLPVYENPLGEEIATVTMLEDKQDKITSSNKLSASLVDGLKTVATSGSYDDLINKPTIPDASKHGYTQLTNEDLNTITEAGWYRAESGNTCKHRPDAFTSTMSFVLEVEKSTDAYTKQTMYKTNANVDSYFTTYIRFSVDSGNTWSSWRRNQIMSDGYQQTFYGRKTFGDGINIYHSPLLFNDSNGSIGQVAMSQGSTTSPKWVNLQVKVNGTTYTADSDGLIDLGTISGGGTTTYNSIGNNIY